MFDDLRANIALLKECNRKFALVCKYWAPTGAQHFADLETLDSESPRVINTSLKYCSGFIKFSRLSHRAESVAPHGQYILTDLHSNSFRC